MPNPSLYSYLIAALLILAMAAGGLWHVQKISPLLRVVAWLILVIMLVGVWLMVRPKPQSDVKTLAEVEARIGNGSPTLLELYSEY